MENIKAKAFDLRKDTVDIVVAGNGGHIGGDMTVDCYYADIMEI